MLLSSIERFAVEDNGGSIASLGATQLTLATQLQPRYSQNGPVERARKRRAMDVEGRREDSER